MIDITSLTLTLKWMVFLLSALYVFPFAFAVAVDVEMDKQAYGNSDDVIVFQVKFDVGDNEAAPVTDLSLTINDTLEDCFFTIEGNPLSGCEYMQIEVINEHQDYSLDHAVVTGVIDGVWQTIDFGQVESYHDNPGEMFEFWYEITWDITNAALGAGHYEANSFVHLDSANASASVHAEEDVIFDVIKTGSSAIGSVGDIETNIVGLEFEVAHAANPHQYFVGVQPVRFTDGSNILVEFDWDFSSVLDISDIELFSEEHSGIERMRVGGIEAPKTLYLAKTNVSTNGICVHDEEILSFDDMSSNCSLAGETALVCDGTMHGNYTCTDLGNFLKIQGLQHSGVYQYYHVPASSPEPDVQQDSSDQSSSSSSGGGSSRSGKSDYRWQCSDWGACTQDNKQTRTCTNIGASPGTFGKPTEEQGCVYEPVLIAQDTQQTELQAEIEEPQEEELKIVEVPTISQTAPPITGNAIGFRNFLAPTWYVAAALGITLLGSYVYANRKRFSL